MPRAGVILRHLFARLRRRRQRPQLVRRTTLHCPHDGVLVEADLLLGPTGRPQLVLRCSAEPSCPPRCDQRCRDAAEAVTGPTDALLILPPGGADEEID